MKHYLLLIGVLVVSLPTLAQNPCDSLKSSNDILKCAIENHASIKLGNSLVKEAQLESVIAVQQPNPEMEAEFDKPILQRGFKTSLQYMHTFELGGKKKARMNLASSQIELSKASVEKQKDSVAINTVLTLHRIRQIDHELEINKEIIQTFEDILTTYKNAGNLDPEKKISVSIFNLALKESLIKKTNLLSERNKHESTLQLSLGKKIKLTKLMLPQPIEEWRILKSNKKAKGSRVHLAESQIALSQSRLLLEKANASQDISLGLKFGFENDKTNSYSIGLVFSMPIPLYNTNRGSIGKALAENHTNELKLDLLKDKLASRKDYLQKVYADTKKVMSESYSHNEVDLNHENLHKMIEKGVISPSSIIELHRQILEFYDRLHQQELSGINALWELHAINGTAQKEELK